MSRPNILYIHSHDTGRYLQPYGYAVPTPTLQRLAHEGMTFRQAFCCAPTCGPSRAALHTGLSPHEAGMDGLTLSGFTLHPEAKILAHRLEEAGYTTVLAGFQHLALKGGMLGYTKTKSGDVPTEEWAAAWLRDQARAGSPFFLDVGFLETHRKGEDYWRGDIEPPNPDDVRPPAHFADTPEARRDWSLYLASATSLDRKVAKVLNALEEAGLAENTLVIYTTDHGIAFPMAKVNLHDEGVGVALILRAPFLGQPRARLSDSMVSHLDIVPTVCEVAGLPVPQGMVGRSLLQLWRDPQQILHEKLFFETTYHGTYDPQRAVRTERWKLIRRFAQVDSPALHVSSQTDAGPIHSEWVAKGWPDWLFSDLQLFDIFFDPNEMCNLVDRPEFAALVSALDQSLTDWMAATGDPLLRGPIPMPMGLDYGLLPHGQARALPEESQREHFANIILERIAAGNNTNAGSRAGS